MSDEPVTTISGIGPATKTQFDRAGIHTAQALRDIGADAAYLRLIETGTRPHFIGYYALHMALQGRPWNDCKGDEKKQFRERYDALLAGSSGFADSSFLRMLDEIGVIAVPK